MRLNDKETALTLAGLRLLQQIMQEGGTKYIPLDILAILDDADVSEGAINDIDELCENKINVAEPETTDAAIPASTTAIIKLDYNAFDKLVNEHLPQAKGKYEFVQAQECGNDTDHLFEGITAEEPSDFDKQWTLPDLERGKLDWRAHKILKLLCRKGAVKPGNYLIQVSW